MKESAIRINIEQLAGHLEAEINHESADNYARVCRLQDTKEYLRRAYHALDDSEFTANDTSYEQMKPIAGVATELLTHRLNVALRALVIIQDMARKCSWLTLRDGTNLETFVSLAIKEAEAAKPQQPEIHDRHEYFRLCQTKVVVDSCTDPTESTSMKDEIEACMRRRARSLSFGRLQTLGDARRRGWKDVCNALWPAHKEYDLRSGVNDLKWLP